MRFSFGGRYSVDEFSDVLDTALETMRHNGVEEVQFANLYVSLHRQGRVVELLDENDQLIEHLKIDAARQWKFRRSGKRIDVIPPTRVPFALPDKGPKK